MSATADRAEAIAKDFRCPRHLPLWRACQWADNRPCLCRVMAEKEAEESKA